MRGLTLEELNTILQFIEKHHKFGGYIPQRERIVERSLHIKYIDFSFDMRDNQIWSVNFRSVWFRTNVFNAINPPPKGFPYDNLFDWIMGYLSEEWYDEKIIAELRPANHL